MKSESKPVKPLNFGVLGEDHFKNWLEKYGGASKTFRYKRMAGVDDESNLPFLVEIAFAVREDQEPRKLITGINWSPTLVDPFRQLADYGMGLESLLTSLHIYIDDPITFALHLVCPHLNYTDRGKSSLEEL